MTVLFTVRLPAGSTKIPFDDVPLLIAKAKNGPADSLDDHALDHYGADLVRAESELIKAVQCGDAELVDSSFYPLQAPFSRGRLDRASITVDALRSYLGRINGALEQCNDETPATDEPIKRPAYETEPSLPTPDIAQIFDGINNMPAKRWSKNLPGTTWMKPAMVSVGGVGRGKEGAHQWNPLILAQLVYGREKFKREKEALMKRLRRLFNTTYSEQLAPWKDAFNEFCETESAGD